MSDRTRPISETLGYEPATAEVAATLSDDAFPDAIIRVSDLPRSELPTVQAVVRGIRRAVLDPGSLRDLTDQMGGATVVEGLSRVLAEAGLQIRPQTGSRGQ